ncbi:unnamed protein product [Darwinula stevensoni]|uniref:Uncharacterized protein n=1 Tax=Darwinula stevensoni TaxID=69355 RepID=A0A7R9A5Y5_9CRUS|nr:unnamed protein product [Darwinula stevensoni]CAG0887541.1 unnamed protein product [Darwinula stevensoni]
MLHVQLQRLTSQGYSLLSVDLEGRTALHHAALRGHKEAVRFLLSSAPPSLVDIQDTPRCQTALHVAAEHRRQVICGMLVAAGASLSLTDIKGRTPRDIAISNGDVNLAGYLES